MADILLNVDGTQKVFKNTVHLAANTESGGKAVYTEESETTTAYLLTDPTGEMPTYEKGIGSVKSTDGTRAIICANAIENVGLVAGLVIYADENTHNMYIYSSQDQVTVFEVIIELISIGFDSASSVSTQSLNGTPFALKAGWYCVTCGMLLCYNATREEMQKALRGDGGIPLDTFDFSKMDDYMKSVFEKTEIAVPKYAQANWNQNDPTKPDYVNGRIGGFFPPNSEATTIEWDGTVGDRPAAIDGSMVLVYQGTIYPPQLYGAKITLATKVGDAEPTTEEAVVTEADVSESYNGMLIDFGYAYIAPNQVEDSEFTLPAGVYMRKYENTRNGVTTTMWISKIEIPAYPPEEGDAKPVPIPRAWLPSDIHSGTTVELDHIILKSTTSGSTKKFKITVDDTGTLTATEVTG